jgi:CheY-like chemotaxis protein
MYDRILVVDDNRDGANALAILLKTLGYQVRAVYDGRSATEQIPEFLPELAFIDIGMPTLDGYDTAKLIRRHPHGRHVILVAVTGWSRAEDKQQAYASGFDLHVVKPMSMETLRETLTLLGSAKFAS